LERRKKAPKKKMETFTPAFYALFILFWINALAQNQPNQSQCSLYVASTQVPTVSMLCKKNLGPTPKKIDVNWLNKMGVKSEDHPSLMGKKICNSCYLHGHRLWETGLTTAPVGRPVKRKVDEVYSMSSSESDIASSHLAGERKGTLMISLAAFLLSLAYSLPSLSCFDLLCFPC